MPKKRRHLGWDILEELNHYQNNILKYKSIFQVGENSIGGNVVEKFVRNQNNL
jgi:hypothetical protein